MKGLRSDASRVTGMQCTGGHLGFSYERQRAIALIITIQKEGLDRWASLEGDHIPQKGICPTRTNGDRQKIRAALISEAISLQKRGLEKKKREEVSVRWRKKKQGSFCRAEYMWAQHKDQSGIR